MENNVILIQGAMDIEVNFLISNLLNPKKLTIAGYEFTIGNIGNAKIVVSKTLIGTINATIATTLGIEKFNPDIVINQGIAGAHKSDIHTGDIIIGEKCCNINAYSAPPKMKNEGSNPFDWEPDKRAKEIIETDKNLVNKLENFFEKHSENKIYVGTLGSGDVFSREVDRINWINDKFSNLSEDMESIGMYTVCKAFNKRCIGIRIISNNEITNEKLDKEQAVVLQKIIINYLSSDRM